MMSKTKQDGQTLILTLIVATVSLIVGAAISSQQVGNLKQRTYNIQAMRAQKAADAGIEEALGIDDLSSANLATTLGWTCGAGTCTRPALALDGANITVAVTEIGTGGTAAAVVEKDQTTQFDLAGYPASRAINVYWAATPTEIANPAALVVSLIYDDGGAKIQKWAYDPNAGTHANNFATPGLGATVGGKTYNYGATITTPAGTPRVLRIRGLYNTTPNSLVIQATGGASFGNQGYQISSAATYGEAQWRAQATKMKPSLPAIFDFAIFSEQDLVK